MFPLNENKLDELYFTNSSQSLYVEVIFPKLVCYHQTVRLAANKSINLQRYTFSVLSFFAPIP